MIKISLFITELRTPFDGRDVIYNAHSTFIVTEGKFEGKEWEGPDSFFLVANSKDDYIRKILEWIDRNKFENIFCRDQENSFENTEIIIMNLNSKVFPIFCIEYGIGDWDY